MHPVSLVSLTIVADLASSPGGRVISRAELVRPTRVMEQLTHR